VIGGGEHERELASDIAHVGPPESRAKELGRNATNKEPDTNRPTV
jgi:hypothetical protein